MMKHAIKAAGSSKHKHKLGAVIVKHGSVLATGYNKVGHRDAFPVYAWPSIHAEKAAILKLLKKKRMEQLADSKIYVIRVMKGGKLGTSKPCEKCMDLIRAVGIKSVVFFDGNKITEEKVWK